VWPNYLDAEKTLFQGRRIPKEKACPNPSVHDISDLLAQWELAHIVEQHKRWVGLRAWETRRRGTGIDVVNMRVVPSGGEGMGDRRR
jgi:signal recognition particle subunit SEC65